MKIGVRHWLSFGKKSKKKTDIELFKEFANELNKVSMAVNEDNNISDKEEPMMTIMNSSKYDYEDLSNKAIDVIRKYNKASYSLLIKELKIGSKTAIKVMKILEDKKLVGPLDKSTNPPTRKIFL